MARPKRATSLRAGVHQTELRKQARLEVTNDGTHEMAVIAVKDLKIDYTYQRVANNRRVNRIANAYDMAKAGCIEISRRSNGDYYIIDGGHRMLGANGAGETELLAHIHVGLTREQEAELFREMNKTRLPIKALEEYKSGLVAKDPRLLEIDGIVRDYGGHIAQDTSDPVGIVAVKSVERVYELAGANGLRRVLSVIRDSYGSLHREHTVENTLKGISAFIEHYSDAGINPLYKRPRLVRELQKTGLDTLLAKARMQQGVSGGAMWLNLAKVIVDIYNGGLKQQNRLPGWDHRR